MLPQITEESSQRCELRVIEEETAQSQLPSEKSLKPKQSQQKFTEFQELEIGMGIEKERERLLLHKRGNPKNPKRDIAAWNVWIRANVLELGYLK